MSTYINFADLTDSVITDFPADIIQNKLELSDNAVEDLAEIKGIRETSEIEKDPVHWKIKRYAIYWVYVEICLDHVGKNNVDIVEQEKYKLKHDLYSDKLKELGQSITVPMITGNVSAVRDRATVGTALLFRG